MFVGKMIDKLTHFEHLANEQISQKGIDNLVWQISDDSQTSPHQTFLLHDISFEENSSKRFTYNLGKLS